MRLAHACVLGACPTRMPLLCCGAARAQVGVQAYLLWEQAGKPDGADFADRAKQLLEGRLRAGESVADVERSLRSAQAPPQAQQKEPQKQQKQQKQQQAPPPPAAEQALAPEGSRTEK